MQIQFRKAEEKDTALVLAFIRELAKYEKMGDQVVARERGCGRLEWWCLDWNAPSIRFYKSLGGRGDDRLDGLPPRGRSPGEDGLTAANVSDDTLISALCAPVVRRALSREHETVPPRDRALRG